MKKQVNLSITPEAYERLRGLAQERGLTVPKLIWELAQESLPTLPDYGQWGGERFNHLPEDLRKYAYTNEYDFCERLREIDRELADMTAPNGYDPAIAQDIQEEIRDIERKARNSETKNKGALTPRKVNKTKCMSRPSKQRNT